MLLALSLTAEAASNGRAMVAARRLHSASSKRAELSAVLWLIFVRFYNATYFCRCGIEMPLTVVIGLVAYDQRLCIS